MPVHSAKSLPEAGLAWTPSTKMLTLTQPTLPPWHSALYLMMIFWFAALVLNASAVEPLSGSGTVTARCRP